MKTYWATFLLRIALAMVFGYFGYHALVTPESQLAYISPTLEAVSPVPLPTVIMFVGLSEVAAALAFLLGVWLPIAGSGAALLLVGIITSIGLLNEIGLRDLGILAACLVIATGEHRLAWQPTVRRTHVGTLIVFLLVLIVTYAWLLTRPRSNPEATGSDSTYHATG